MWDAKLIEWLLAQRRLLSVLVGAVTLVLLVFAVRVEFDNSITSWLLDDDPDMIVYREFLDRFGADEVSVIGVFADDVFTPEVLAAIDQITRKAEAAPYAHRVRSLTNVHVARGDDGLVAIEPLVPKLPRSAAEARRIRKHALANRTLSGTMVSADGKAAAIIVELEQEGNSFAGKVALVEALRAIAKDAEAAAPITTVLAGTPPFDEAFYKHTTRDFALFAPLSLAMVFLAIFLLFRRLSAVLVPLAVVLVGLVWLFGVMGIFGLRISLVSTILPTVVLAVGVATSIHVLADYYNELSLGSEPHQAVAQSFCNLLVPCFFTTATTVAGMLSLLSSSLQPIREFGWLAALGVTFAFLLSMVVAPLLLLHTRLPDSRFLAHQRNDHTARFIAWLARPTRRRSAITLVVFTLLVAASVLGLGRLQVGANVMNYFKKNDPVRASTERVDAALGGSTSLEFFIKAGNEGFLQPANLKAIEQLQASLEALPSVGRALAITDVLKDTYRVLQGGDPSYYKLPENRPLIAQLFLLLEGEEDFAREVQDNYGIGRLSARARLSRAGDLVDHMSKIEAELKQLRERTGVDVRSTGFVKLMGKMEVYLLDSQIESFIIAFVVITLMLALLLRSLRLALFSMIPNFTPILLGLAFMGAMGIPLDPGTVMIGSVALGLVVDDTVHLLVRVRRRLRAGDSIEGAIETAMLGAGRPVISTSLVLALGFSVLVAASFTPNINFGAVTSLVVMLALAADLFVLPAALQLVRPRMSPKAPPQVKLAPAALEERIG